MVIDRFDETITPQERELWLSQIHQDIDGQGVNWADIKISFDDVCQAFIKSMDNDPDKILADAKIVAEALDKWDFLDEIDRYKIGVEKATADNMPELAKAWERQLKKYRKSFDGCFAFVNTVLDFHITATAELIKEDKEAATFYFTAYTMLCEDTAVRLGYKPPKRTTGKKQAEPGLVPSIGELAESPRFFALPTGPITNLLYEALTVGAELESLGENKADYNRHGAYDIKAKNNSRQITYTREDSVSLTLEIPEISALENVNPRARSLLVRIFIEANKQAVHSGELSKSTVTFPLRDLIGNGPLQYGTLRAARQGFYNNMKALAGLMISGKITKGKKNTIQQGAVAVLFPYAEVNRSVCEITLNDKINWEFVFPYYTTLPAYFFELSPRAADLLEYVFRIARQRAAAIELNEKTQEPELRFTISYRAIQDHIKLPRETQPDGTPTRNPQRDIKDALENAIDEIADKCRAHTPKSSAGSEPDFTLTPERDLYDAPIKQYLDEGKLAVTLKGEYAKRFIEINQKAAAKIEAARKRNERIEAEARTRNLAAQLAAGEE